jgi:putative SOS response-associated peptidase YedK
MCYFNSLALKPDQKIKINTIEKQLTNQTAVTRAITSGFEYTTWPIITPVDGGKDADISLAHWEFIAPWIKTSAAIAENRKKFNTLNATAENLLTSKLFRNAALHQRCLILSSGFYEWRHYKPQDAKKDIAYPYYITLPHLSYFFMAGIYQPWVDQETGEAINTFAIVTAKANALMEQVHNTKKRMPVILTEDLAHQWLQNNLPEKNISELASYQYNSSLMQASSIHKNFRTAVDPQTPFIYPELPPLT